MDVHQKQSFTSALRDNIDLFTESEIAQLAFDVANNLKRCTTKQEQFTDIMQLLIECLYSFIPLW